MVSYLKWNKNSLLAKLLLSFLGIIVLAFSFHLFSFRFFVNRIQDEIVQNNQANLEYTVQSFEKQFQLVDDVLTSYFLDGRTKTIRRDLKHSSFTVINDLADSFETVVSTNNLHIENVFVHYKEESFIIDRKGATSAHEMFGSYYVNLSYDEPFWNRQFDEDYHFRVFPAAIFQGKQWTQPQASAAPSFPVIAKHKLNNQFYIGAFLNAQMLYASFHQSANKGFAIMDDNRRIYFSTTDTEWVSALADRSQAAGYVKRDFNYYFYHKGAVSGLTYVSIVPYRNIVSQVNRMNYTLFLILAVTILLSLIASVLLSVRFRSPIQAIMEAVQKRNPNILLRSNIREFRQISSGISRIMQQHDSIHEELHHKNALLQQYGYLDRIKSINIHNREVQKLLELDKSFYLVMFHIDFVGGFPLNEHQAVKKSGYFVEFIRLNMSQACPEAVTLQSDKDIMISIVFNDGQPVNRIHAALQFMLQVFDQDRDYYRTTIAFKPESRQEREFNQAYEEALEMIHQRKLNDRAQIVTEHSAAAVHPYFDAIEERRFVMHLQAGNEADMLQMIGKMLDRLRKKNATAYPYKQFTDNVISKVLMEFMNNRLDVALLQQTASCEKTALLATVEQYAEFYKEFITLAADAIRNNKKEKEEKETKDPIIDYVLAYFNNHYNEEIYQDLLAEKLNISPGYLSNYVKEKTGITFIDHLNEIRISRAKELLERTDCKIHEVASQVGYVNANSFTRMFRRMTGITPGEYRRNQKSPT